MYIVTNTILKSKAHKLLYTAIQRYLIVTQSFFLQMASQIRLHDRIFIKSNVLKEKT